ALDECAFCIVYRSRTRASSAIAIVHVVILSSDGREAEMTEKKARGPRKSDRPPGEVGAELKAQRDKFVHTFFKRGAEFTEELVRENDRLRKQIAVVETENTRLRTQLASDTAIRDLLKKIEQLEDEKEELLSSVHEAEEVTSRFTNRFAEIESELE